MVGALLQVEDLNVSYNVNGRWIPAVRDFHLRISSGQIVGLVGESGSGKSTVAGAIMRALSSNGRIEPGSRILFEGEDLCQKSRGDMRPIWGSQIKLVPQNPGAALNPSLTVGQQTAEIARWYMGANRYDARAKAIEMFRRVRLADPENVFDRYAHQISGGMQQRVLIAMALMTSPRLLILDEPTTGLDVTTEAVILDLVRDLMADVSAGALYVTHNLGVVAQLCERVIVLYAGEIMTDSRVEDLYERPLHPYAAGLLKSVPRPGQSRQHNPLQSIEGHPPSLREVPAGCVYAPRCPVVLDQCHTEKPALEILEEGDENKRCVRCHRWREIAGGDVSVLDEGLPDEAADAVTAPGARENLLGVANLTRHFPVRPDLSQLLRRQTPPPVRAVDGVNLRIQKGRTLGLVGESGSGKTTLSRVIVGLTDRTDGEITLVGVDVPGSVRERDPETLAQVQMIFQNPQNSLNPYLTVGQAIRRPLIKLAGMNREQADGEVARLLEAVNLRAEYAERYPAELSGGEKQRAVIARAFASNPNLIVCDEPVSALDVSVQAAVLNLLARLQEEHDTSYLFISHDLAVVGYLADYVAVMYLGQLFEVGYARDMFDPPLHPYTEALISAIPVPDPSRKITPVILGDNVPSARNIPAGCRFHTRCQHKIGEICETEVPPWRDSEEGHHIRCHIPLEELGELQAGITRETDKNRSSQPQPDAGSQ